MASKVKRGFIYYLAWFIFMALGLVCIFGAILMFNPGKDVFGINLCYAYENINDEFKTINVGGKNYMFSELTLNTINVNTKHSDLVITTDASKTQYGIKVSSKLVGFAKHDKYSKYSVSFNYNSGILDINVTEPEMSLALNNNSKIEIVYPSSLQLSSTNLNFNTESGSFSMGYNEQFNHSINSLNINSKTGSVNLGNNANILSGNIKIESDKSKLDINCNVSNELQLNINSGKLNLDSITGNLKIESESLTAKCDGVLGNVNYSCDNGYIQIKSIGSSYYSSNFTASEKTRISNIIIDKIYGDVIIPKGNDSDITIGEIYGQSLIETTSGNVNIRNSKNTISIRTTSGDVNVLQYGSPLITSIITTTGNIVANFAQISYAKLESNSGKITINVVEDLPFVLNYDTGKAIKIPFILEKLAKVGVVPVATLDENHNSVITAKTSNYIYLNNDLIVD